MSNAPQCLSIVSIDFQNGVNDLNVSANESIFLNLSYAQMLRFSARNGEQESGNERVTGNSHKKNQSGGLELALKH